MKLRRQAMVVAVVALIAAACGRSGSSTTTTSASGGSSTTAASASGPGDFGTLKGVCGPGTAKGSTDTGVTDTAINVGTMADPGATVAPGLDQEIFDTAKAYVAWCNAAGGILGRKLNLDLLDSALFNVAQKTLASCPTDFAQVGSGAAFDDAGVAPRTACKQPIIPAYLNAPKAADAPLQVQPTPLNTEQQEVAFAKAFKNLFPSESKFGFLVGNLASVVVTKDRFKEAAQLAGLNVIYDASYPITGLANAESYVQQMKSAGVQGLMEVGDSSALQSLEKAMQTVGWYPDAILLAGNFYDENIPKNLGTALKNTWVVENYIPFEEAANNPATQQYLNLMKQYNPSGKIAALGLNTWNAFLLFSEAAKACGANLTRTCLLDQAAAQKDWTGGGLQSPVTLAQTNPQMTQCYLILKAGTSGFALDKTALPPNQGPFFNCDPSNVVQLKGSYH